MNFTEMTAEDLLSALPLSEDNKWEFKSARLLEPASKGEFKNEIGKQVSAFSNSGGGYLLLGLNDKNRTLEACPVMVNRQTMKDYLATITEQSVEDSIQNFRIHQLTFTNDITKAVFVVEIGDSEAAPHQAKGDRQYYYRIDGHSKPAPHFHLKLLRERRQQCVVEPILDSVDIELPKFGIQEQSFKCNITVAVENRSSFVAMPAGISFKLSVGSGDWSIKDVKESLAKCHTTRAFTLATEFIFPTQKDYFSIPLRLAVPKEHDLLSVLELDWDAMRLQIQSFSQNYASGVIEVIPSSHCSMASIKQRHEQNLFQLAEWQEKARAKMSEMGPAISQQVEFARNSVLDAIQPRSFRGLE